MSESSIWARTAPVWVAAASLVAGLLAVTASVAEAASPPATFAPPVDHAVGHDPHSVALGDLDGDLDLDMVVADIRGDTVWVRLGDGSGGFASTGAVLLTLEEPFSVALADLDLDGALDLVVTHGLSHLVSVRLGNGAGGFGSSVDLDAGMFATLSVAVGDLNGDTFPDLAVTGGESAPFGVSVLLGDGTGGFGSATLFPTDEYPSSVAVGDLNGDAALDLAVTNAGASTLSVLLGDGGGSFAPASHFATGSEPISVALADLDGDLHLDAVVANNASNDLSVLLGDGAGGFSPKMDVAAGATPRKVVVEDLNGDLHPDLVVAGWQFPNPSGASVLLGNGTGGFDAATFYATGESGTWSVAVGDLDDDGRADLVVANSEPNGLEVSNGVSVLLNTTAPVVPGAPTGTFAVAADGAATVSWTTPASNGGSPITAYTVTAYVGYFPAKVTTFDSTTTTRLITGLTNGNPYWFTVAAINDAGVGVPSGPSNVVRYGPPTVKFGSAQAKSVLEGASGLRTVTVNVNLDWPSTEPVTVFWNTANGTAGARDYEGAYGWLAFTPGETTKAITVRVKGDTLIEPDDVFTIRLSSPTGAVLSGTSTKPIIITNDD